MFAREHELDDFGRMLRFLSGARVAQTSILAISRLITVLPPYEIVNY